MSRSLALPKTSYGSLWIATSNHVLRVNRDRLMRGRLADGDMREYGLADGLRGVEGVKRHRSVVADSFGRIWFSLNRGISVVDPARLSSNAAPVIVHIQSISADGSPVASGSVEVQVRIPSGRQRVTFDFAGLNLSHSRSRSLSTIRLDGFDRGWSEPVATREAVYTNLRPGPYRFHVMASNPTACGMATEAAIAFEIEPAFWQTWWFRLGVVLACALGILALYRLRLRQTDQAAQRAL